MFFDPAYQSLKNGLVGYWSPVATGATGLQLLDLSGQNNHGTLTNMDAPTDWVQSPYGTVLDFDATNDQILNTSPQGLVSTTSQAASFWVNLRSLTVANNITLLYLGRTGSPFNQQMSVGFNIFGQGPSNNTSAFNVLQYSGSSNPTGAYTSATFGSRLNEWLHFVCGWDGSAWRIFVNGAEDTVAYLSGGPTTGFPLQMSIASGQSGVGTNWGRFFDGRIAEVAYWHRFPTRSEIQTLYNLGPGKLLRSKPTGGPSKRKWWPGVKTPKPRPIIPAQRGIKSGPIFYDPKAAWLKNGLVGHWCPSATSPTGTQLLDLSGQNNNGTLTNMASTSWVASGGKGALDFDGVDDYVATPVNSQSFLFVSAWVNFTSSGSIRQIYTADDGTSNRRWQFRWNGTQIQLIVFRSSDATNNNAAFTIALNSGTWRHVAGSWDGQTIVVFVDGIARASQSFSGTPVGVGTNSNARIGADAIGSNYFAGQIDDVRVYNRALTPSEVAALYAGGRGYGVSNKPYRRSSYSPAPKKIFKSRIDRKRSVSLVHPDHDNEWVTNGLVGFWCPSLTSPTGTQLLDLSGQNNNGTLTNMDVATSWVQSGGKGALSFDRVNDQIPTTCPGITTSSRSCSVWFNTSIVLANAQYSPLLKWGTAATFPADIGKGFTVAFGNDANFGSTGIGISQYGDAIGVTGFNDGRWHFGYFESIGSVYSIYIDGVFRASKTMTTNATAGTVVIGQDLGNFYSGQLDDVRVYNRALTADEIVKLYAGGRGFGFSNRPSRSPTWMVDPIYNQTNRLSSFPG